MTLVNKFYGDVAVVESDFIFGRIIRPWTGKYNHTAMRTRRNIYAALEETGLEIRSRLNLPKQWKSVIDVRHKDMDDFGRRWLRLFDKEVPMNYDFLLIGLLGVRDKFRDRDDLDLSRKNKFTCSSRIAFMYNKLGLPIKDGIHWSQTYPVDFLRSSNFNVYEKWFNPKFYKE